MIYLKLPDGERTILDEKVDLVIEGAKHTLVGAHLDLYDVQWTVGRGTLGDDEMPCRVLRVRDTFTGLEIDIPFLDEQAKSMAKGLSEKRSFLKR